MLRFIVQERDLGALEEKSLESSALYTALYGCSEQRKCDSVL